MTTQTVKSMELLLQKGSKRINTRVSEELKDRLQKACKKRELSESDYFRLALVKQLELDEKV